VCHERAAQNGKFWRPAAAGLAISQPAGGMTRSWPAFPEIKAVGGYTTSCATVVKRA